MEGKIDKILEIQISMLSRLTNLEHGFVQMLSHLNLSAHTPSLIKGEEEKRGVKMSSVTTTERFLKFFAKL